MRKLGSNGVEKSNSLKQLIRDIKKHSRVDFITNYEEVQRLQKYKHFSDAYLNYRAQGNSADDLGCIVGYGENFEQFFLLPKSFVEKLGELLNKKLSELTSEERMLLIDDSSPETIDVLQESVV